MPNERVPVCECNDMHCWEPLPMSWEEYDALTWAPFLTGTEPRGPFIAATCLAKEVAHA